MISFAENPGRMPAVQMERDECPREALLIDIRHVAHILALSLPSGMLIPIVEAAPPV
jgi:hypothetical protein